MTGEGMTGNSGRARRSRRGMTLIEAMIAMAIVAVAMLALVSLIVSSGTVQDDSRQRTIAYNAARDVIENMRALIDITKIYDAYKQGGSVGNEFWIADIPHGDGSLKTTVPTGEAQFQAQGKILFPEKTPGAGEIMEDPPSPADDSLLARQLGMPKDLNQNGTDTDTLAPAEVMILPVKVRVRWLASGNRYSNIEVITFITVR